MRRSKIIGGFLAAIVCFTTSTSARSLSEQLFTRASVCADSFTQCSQAGLPSNFCCSQSTTCLVLAGNTTVLCCPTGSSCSTIAPITCDITAQNATLHPNNALKTTALTLSLPTCGSNCCPFGYTCNSSGNCQLSSDQSTAPGTSSSSSSTKSSTTASSTTASKSTSTPASTSTTTSLPTATLSPQTNSTSTTTTLPIQKSCNAFPAGAVLAGFFPGLMLGVLLTVASICIMGAARRRRNQVKRSSSPSFGNISDPQPSSDIRTDFLRKVPQTPSSQAPSSPARQGSLYRVRSLFRKSHAAQEGPRFGEASPVVPPLPLNVQRNKIPSPVGGGSVNSGPQRPVTPILQREPSYEDVPLFADKGTLAERQRMGRESSQTTFTDMIEKSRGLAGLPKNQRSR
ncbi:hypothetical protein BP5796_09170 [Coleophoma crateriformis]|uniref:Mid2 domain-containing protein n=1 Tax=Coleophoma crateriformis TaxID=565419 RepID=A0A3D8R388_9HELO|nr:hypothetical protein BP5796_09170 [Coleophoma crateriformis]